MKCTDLSIQHAFILNMRLICIVHSKSAILYHIPYVKKAYPARSKISGTKSFTSVIYILRLWILCTWNITRNDQHNHTMPFVSNYPPILKQSAYTHHEQCVVIPITWQGSVDTPHAQWRPVSYFVVFLVKCVTYNEEICKYLVINM